MDQYDVIVGGLGAMGSATTYQLAKAGVKVLGFDQFEPPHAYGSSHGDTRVTRLAIGEGAAYVPLVKRSHELWREIERETGEDLFVQCGGLIMSVPGSQGQHGITNFVDQTIAVSRQYGIAHEDLTGEQIKARYPAFNVSDSTIGYYEPEAGYLYPEKCIKAQLELAKKHGASLNLNEHVLSWTSTGSSVTVKTDKGTYEAEKLILAVGPWINDLLGDRQQTFKVYRQVMYWFDIKEKGQYHSLNNLPVYIWMFGLGENDMIYGFPALDGPNGGMKLAAEEYAVATSPDKLERTVIREEINSTYERFVVPNLPELSDKCIKARACMYTVTPDQQFVIDFHPDYKNVVVASPCSGHGFKNSAAIGETLAQLIADGRSSIDISAFSLSRFS